MPIQNKINIDNKKTITYTVQADSVETKRDVDTLDIENGYMVVDNETGTTLISLEGKKTNYNLEIIIAILIAALFSSIFWLKRKKRKKTTVPLSQKETSFLLENLERLMLED